ncbi:hypothetical protein [Pseudotenacibaculum haliotis]|uniref:DUF4468 domain-containing protein n=1 Tax=Pseudotenacibaculum haliotis TaxID=1862138 RepID=A0ABW5LNZ3_9FLAO
MNSLRLFIVFSIILFSGKLHSQFNPFKDLKYDKVVAFEYQGEGGLQIQKALKKESSKITKRAMLSKEQTKALENIIISPKSYGNTTASCFDPHFAIVYYKNDKVLASVSICLDCNYLISSVEIPATKHKMIKVSDDYSYPAKGFSKEARKQLHSYIKALGFTKFLKPLNTIMDK